MVIIPTYDCSRCGREGLPLDQMKLAGYKLTRRGRLWASWCMECHRENGRERARRERKDPRGRKRLNAASRRYKAKRKAAPALHAIDLENARIAHRLRQEKRGRSLEEIRRGPVTIGVTSEEETPPHLPAAPLARAVLRKVEALEEERPLNSERRALLDAPDLGGYCDGFSARDAVCERLGISVRTLWRWESKPDAMVLFDTADRVLLGLKLDWSEVWDEADLPDWLTASA